MVDFWRKGNLRTILLKKNILGSFLLRGSGYLISYVRVPLVLDYINVSEYGIWITLSSLIGWFAILDIGLGNGLRNKLAESLAINDLKSAKMYVSTTYAAILIIIGAVYLIFLAIAPWIDWTSIFNAPATLATEVYGVTLITFTAFALQFILNLILTVLTADQRPTLGSAIGTAGSVLFLVVIIILKQTTPGSLIYLGLVSGGSTLLALLAASVYFYRGRYKSIRPAISAVNFKHFRDLAGVGIQFFLIQIVAIIMFSTDNMIITQVQGPEEVTPYILARKYMEIVPAVMSMIMFPLWSAYTEAYVTKDYVWIKKTINILIKIWCASIVIGMLQLVPAKWFFHMWIGDKLEVPLMLLLLMGVYYILVSWCQIFGFFINGVGKIRLQLYMGIIQAVINIPISIFFAKYLGMGSAGVILGTCVCLGLGAVWAPIQYYKIINGTAQGIWAK